MFAVPAPAFATGVFVPYVVVLPYSKYQVVAVPFGLTVPLRVAVVAAERGDGAGDRGRGGRCLRDGGDGQQQRCRRAGRREPPRDVAHRPHRSS